MPAPLLTAHDATDHIHLIIGANPLAGARCAKSIAAGARPIIIAPENVQPHYTLEKRIEDGKLEFLRRDFQDEDLKTLGRQEVDGYVDAVFVTSSPRGTQAAHISSLCRRLRIPVNVVDAPNLCTFTLLSTYSDGPLQVGITTSGKGCKLASRIRREISASLPPNLGTAIDRLGSMRRRIWEEDHKLYDADDLAAENSDDDGPGQSATFNKLVLEEDRTATRTRRMRWLTQICEYWPLRRLADISDADVDAILRAYQAEGEALSTSPPKGNLLLRHKPRIILAGSGPGSPHLLTMATHRAIQSATFVLADKLVPAAVMDLIPRRATVHIARKFPGNAEAAQQELLSLGLDALKSGQHSSVLRLKQGDPYLYGRGGEELLFFRKEGVEVTVLPGITSALSAPLFGKIPVTHRGVAEKVLICTGTGRKGKVVKMPEHESGLTLVVLMGLHRLEALVDTLVGRRRTRPPIATGASEYDVVRVKRDSDANTELATKDRGAKVEGGEIAEVPEVPLQCPWPEDTPCAVLERASCPDQRVIRTTLKHVVDAVEQEGSRPPGLFVVGNACEALQGRGGSRWVVEDGFQGLEGLMEGAEMGLESVREREGPVAA